MIDAQAVTSQLEKLGDLPSRVEGTQPAAGSAWLREALHGLALEHRQDAAGNAWVTLNGSIDRAVLLGSYEREDAGAGPLDSHVGMVAGLETLKALAHRYGSAAPCTVQLVVWATPQDEARQQSGPGASLPFPQNVTAYLELHVEPEAQLQESGTPLGVGTALEGESSAFHPRLAALCDEAIRELTGTSAALPLGLTPIAAEIARAEIPVGVMCVQSVAGAAARDLPSEKRLHLLQAAESFGRWAEATMHLVAGDPVDLWAREHRVPRG